LRRKHEPNEDDSEIAIEVGVQTEIGAEYFEEIAD